MTDEAKEGAAKKPRRRRVRAKAIEFDLPPLFLSAVTTVVGADVIDKLPPAKRAKVAQLCTAVASEIGEAIFEESQLPLVR